MQPAQACFVLRNALGQAVHHGRFLLHRLQEEVAQAVAVQGVEVVGGLAALGGGRDALEMHLADPRQDGFGCANSRVLADNDGAAKWRLVGFVAGRLHAAGA
ncbi:hypothetical protein D9M68_962040 [compost metagenome]